VRLAQTLKSASFKLTAAYVGLFAASVGILAFVTYLLVNAQLSRDFHSRIFNESKALEVEFHAGGTQQLIRTIADRQRVHMADGLDYTLLNKFGSPLFGSLPHLPCKKGWQVLIGPPDGDEPPGEMERLGALITPLPGGLCLIVGDDLGRIDNFGTIILKAFGWISLLSLTLAITGGLFLSSRFLKRIESITKTAEAIIAGDITRRIPRRGASDDLDRLGVTLNRMLDRMSALMESLKHLSNDIAHDLRTPLGRLRRLLDSARSDTLRPDEYETIIDRSVVEVDAILDTFGAILRIAQIESGNRRSAFQRLCLSDLVDEVYESFAPSLEEDGRTVKQWVERDLWICGDRELITLSLANLLENCTVHTPSNSTVTIWLRRVGECAELVIADDGEGVPEGERTRIFQRFYRLEASRTAAGSGLGLSIVSAVADLHAAKLTASDNQPGLRIAMLFPVSTQPSYP
jgi:signal transduction histidine kinase